MKRLLTIGLFVMLAVVTASSQQRIPCVRHIQGATTRGYYVLPEPITQWDAQRTYRVPVVLITFKDCEFSMSDPVAYYRRLFNEEGFNEGKGKGCVADYFLEQSGGLCHLQFDIYGPIQVDTTAHYPSGNYGDYSVEQALKQLSATTDADFSVYDWTGDGAVNQVVFVAAGYTGNSVTGYIWPNTCHTYWKAPGNLSIQMTSISCEKWGDDRLCGIGTIVHEFSHCLGLPDIYPTSGSLFSVVDEWDLMDGGNYTNYGWCPPNFSTMEKMFLGWATPTELKSSTTITGMKPVSEGGETFIIRNSAYKDEFYLLENRKQTGWDYGTPGNGLLIFHVDYDYGRWCDNNVNGSQNHLLYSLIAADNKSYRDWDPRNDGKDPNKWTMSDRLRNKYLSTAPYPCFNEETTLIINQSLTDESIPSSMVYKGYQVVVGVDKDGKDIMEWHEGNLSKPITNIQVASDGSVSFDFMKEPTSIREALFEEQGVEIWYDLHGHQLPEVPRQSGIYILRGQNGKTKKIIK